MNRVNAALTAVMPHVLSQYGAVRPAVSASDSDSITPAASAVAVTPDDGHTRKYWANRVMCFYTYEWLTEEERNERVDVFRPYSGLKNVIQSTRARSVVSTRILPAVS